MPVQLKTLLPLLVVFILIFLIARHFLVPESFGKYGHYRADSIEEIGALEINYAGKITCIECHDTEAEMLAADQHASLSCEICHGPNARHADDYEVKDYLIKNGSRELCGTCHNRNAARNPEVITQVDIKEHHLEKKDCIDCHNPHAVWELKE